MRSNFNTGKGTEDLVKIMGEIYESQGRAVLRKVDPPTRTIRIAGKPVVIQLDNPFLDFVGTWTERAGRMLVIEVKSTKVARLDVGKDSGVNAKQLAALHAWEKGGAAVGVIWMCDERSREMRFVSLQRIEACRAEGRASVPWKDAYNIPQGMGLLTHDFLAILSAIYPCTL